MTSAAPQDIAFDDSTLNEIADVLYNIGVNACIHSKRKTVRVDKWNKEHIIAVEKIANIKWQILSAYCLEIQKA